MASISMPTWSLSLNPLSSFPPKRTPKPFVTLAAAASSSSTPVGEPDSTSSGGDGKKVNGDSESKFPASVKLAMEKAREYKKKKGSEPKNTTNSAINSGSEKMNVMNTKDVSLTNTVSKKDAPKMSSIDFVGFGFSDKKRYSGPPPGLAPVVEPLLDGEIPEVEIIVGDASKFDVTTPRRKSSNIDAGNPDLYKPKVSTWGVFPRPNDISKTFGGGRVIQPGEVLETVEEKAAKDKRTKELIETYRRKRGLTIDAKTKSECEKALKEGDYLMDLGKLPEALPFYEKVMKAVVFQSDLHGRAALQWSICQDSLRSIEHGRLSEARSMYEKLQSHPNVEVSKQARQFVFSFQAMEMMKVRSSSFSRTTGFENYFAAFVENKGNYSPTKEDASEGVLGQALPYIVFLVSPILFVFFIAVNIPFSL